MMDNKELCYMLDNQLERLVQKGDITPNELHSIYEAVKTKYYLTVIKAMEEAKEYDEYGYSGRRMSMSYDGRPYFDNQQSMARGRDSMGRYTSRDGGNSRESGYSREGYSREGGYSGADEMRHHLEMAMNAAKTEQERQSIRNMMNNM